MRCMTTFLLSLSILSAQTDPGPRPGPVGGVGQSVSGMTAGETQMFLAGADVFQEVDSVAGNEPGASGSGLGPRFNMNSCKGCHAHPQVGGSSPPDNPQIEVATRFGANNIVPPFIKADGPIRVVRFPRGPNGMPDGGVHALFVISGRADAGNCNIPQPDFANAVAQNNAIFR